MAQSFWKVTESNHNKKKASEKLAKVILEAM
jgi:hypothetical protein